MNIFGELLDLQAGDLLDENVDAAAIVSRVQERYGALWDELTGTEEFTVDEMWRIEQRIARLNELGFDADELDIVTDWDGSTVRVQPKVVEAGHHTRELQRLTGLTWRTTRRAGCSTTSPPSPPTTTWAWRTARSWPTGG